MNDGLTADECRLLVLSILESIQSGHPDVAVKIAGLAADPEELREIISG